MDIGIHPKYQMHALPGFFRNMAGKAGNQLGARPLLYMAMILTASQ